MRDTVIVAVLGALAVVSCGLCYRAGFDAAVDSSTSIHAQALEQCRSTYHRAEALCASASRCGACDPQVRYFEWCPVWTALGEEPP